MHIFSERERERRGGGGGVLGSKQQFSPLGFQKVGTTIHIFIDLLNYDSKLMPIVYSQALPITHLPFQ